LDEMNGARVSLRGRTDGRTDRRTDETECHPDSERSEGEGLKLRQADRRTGGLAD